MAVAIPEGEVCDAEGRSLNTFFRIIREKDWLTVCYDGLTYSVILNLSQEYMVCKVCSGEVLGTDKWQAHTRQKHPDLPEQEYVLEFDWGHVKTGDGHYEMNLMKSYVELNREVFFKELAEQMGWKSEIALQ